MGERAGGGRLLWTSVSWVWPGHHTHDVSAAVHEPWTRSSHQNLVTHQHGNRQHSLGSLGCQGKTGMDMSGDGNVLKMPGGQLAWIQSNPPMIFNTLLTSCPCVSGFSLTERAYLRESTYKDKNCLGSQRWRFLSMVSCLHCCWAWGKQHNTAAAPGREKSCTRERVNRKDLVTRTPTPRPCS